jgi:uncharacterized protein YndB with AHSA1/START domain
MAELRKELTLTRVINAPRETVFRAWTEPELLVQWWGPAGMTSNDCVVDLRVGGEFRIEMVAGEDLGERAGQRSPVRAVFQEIEIPERLVFTNQAVDDDGTVHLDGTTTVLFEDSGDGMTRLTVHAVAEGRTEQ